MSSSSEPTDERPECFVIMPFSDPDGYSVGHFRRVFEDIFKPACEKADFRAVRADEVAATNMIHLDLLQRLLASPLVLCDLTSRNPNVLFELGLRQAFDKPVVLVREEGTPPIFDIAPLRYVDYRPACIYHEVLEDQAKITSAIRATMAETENQQGINSLVRLLGLTRSASLEDVAEANTDPAFQLLRAELQELRGELRRALRTQSSHRFIESPPSDDAKLVKQRGLSAGMMILNNLSRQLMQLDNKITDYSNNSVTLADIQRELYTTEGLASLSEREVFVLDDEAKKMFEDLMTIYDRLLKRHDVLIQELSNNNAK